MKPDTQKNNSFNEFVSLITLASLLVGSFFTWSLMGEINIFFYNHYNELYSVTTPSLGFITVLIFDGVLVFVATIFGLINFKGKRKEIFTGIRRFLIVATIISVISYGFFANYI